MPELLQLIAGCLASDPARLAASLLAYIGNPAQATEQLRHDLDRFAFRRGGRRAALRAAACCE